MTGSVLVVGSANADIVHRVERIPTPGETVRSTGVSVRAGGKGLNQGVAAALAGTPSTLIVAVGEDRHADLIRRAAVDAGVDTRLMRRVSAPTGVAIIAVDDAGENAIIVQGGANGLLIELSEADRDAIRSADVVVCQLEIALDVVLEVARVARAAGRLFILNPSPVRPLPTELLSLVDVLVVNEHEARELDATFVGIPCVITTMGPAGAIVRFADEPVVAVSPRITKAVDTTGAGDTFVGVLAAEIAAGEGILVATGRATLAASLSVEREGALSSMPTKADIDAAATDAGLARRRP